MNEADKFESRVPEFDAMAALQQKLAQKRSETSSGQSAFSNGSFNPHQLMVKRRSQNAGEALAEYPVQNWSQKDINNLEEFCRKHGIFGFNCGTMSPAAALALLKGKLGVIDDPPKTEGYGPNYPYGEIIKKKILLSG